MREKSLNRERTTRQRLVACIVLIACLLLLLTRIVTPLDPSASNAATNFTDYASDTAHSQHGIAPILNARPPALPSAPEQIVARKLTQFAKSRREYAHELARRRGVSISPDVEAFFAAVESGNWDEISRTFGKLNGGDSTASASRERDPNLTWIWPAIIDAYGTAEQVHLWPAAELLDYGKQVLESLRPGMVYVGGTDSGRWIPEFLNDTSDEPRHVVITQNAFADTTYLEYMKVQYEGRLELLSESDFSSIFEDYKADARKRLQHDQDHPNEPKQVLPGENLKIVGTDMEVTGRTAVNTINEKLLQTLLKKNPDVSFAMQESFPIPSAHAEAVPLGPIMELRARDADGPVEFTFAQASESLNYWRNRASEVLQNPRVAESPEALKSYSHDAAAAANLLAARGFTSEAEQAYRVSAQLWPGNPESTAHLANLMFRTGKAQEAQRILQDFTTRFPAQREAVERLAKP